MATSLIIQEPPLLVFPTLAKLIGLEGSIVLQQLYFLLQNPRNGRVISGERWIYNTYEEWVQHFPWMSERSLRRVFGDLQRRGIVLSCQPEGALSRRKYCRISHGTLPQLTYERVADQISTRAPDAAKSGASNRSKVSLPLAEKTIRDNNHQSIGHPSADRDRTSLPPIEDAIGFLESEAVNPSLIEPIAEQWLQSADPTKFRSWQNSLRAFAEKYEGDMPSNNR